MNLSINIEPHEMRLQIEDFFLPLALGRVEREIEEATILLRSVDGTLTPALRRHFENHFGRSQRADGACAFCKLQGKILHAQGRERPSEGDFAKARIYVADEPRITHIRPGVTAEGIMRNEEDRIKRAQQAEQRRLRSLPQVASKFAVDF